MPGHMILLTGATGYVGGRLLKALEGNGEEVRCLVRRPRFLASRVGPGTKVVEGDLLRPETLGPALKGIHTAYYLVHSMASSGSFQEIDRQAAINFANAAREAGVSRIIYLGGLGRGDTLSPHLASRQEVGVILRASGIPCVELRASIVIGSGSLSFEMVRAIVEKLPVLIAPRWVRMPAQPIAIEDLIAYLVESLHIPLEGQRLFEIGGADQVSYLDLMKEYARQRGLKRIMLTVPVLTPGLSSLWLGLVTPVYARVGRKLIDSVRHATIVEGRGACSLFKVRPRGFESAISRALQNEDQQFAVTRWSDALSSFGGEKSWAGRKLGSRIIDSRSVRVPHEAAVAYDPVSRLGGKRGWYYANFLWRIRGFMDLLLGGPGMRRGRRDPVHLRVGDTLDFWRVEEVVEGRVLRLAAEMKVPGRAWLQFDLEPAGHDVTILRQTAIFEPLGLFGLLYWYGLYPLHKLVFRGMLMNLARAMG
jgi:uncharacterized protein YbjT (DUF2867 family)